MAKFEEHVFIAGPGTNTVVTLTVSVNADVFTTPSLRDLLKQELQNAVSRIVWKMSEDGH